MVSNPAGVKSRLNAGPSPPTRILGRLLAGELFQFALPARRSQEQSAPWQARYQPRRLATVSPTFAQVASGGAVADQTPPGCEEGRLSKRLRHGFLARPVASHPVGSGQIFKDAH